MAIGLPWGSCLCASPSLLQSEIYPGEIDMKRDGLRPFISGLFLFICSLSVYGQVGTTAPLSGAVVDPAGAVLAGAAVVVRNSNTGAEYKVTTSNHGTFTVPALGAGVYTVTIELAGFKKAVVEEVKIDAGVPATINVVLEVGAASESV